MVPMDRESRPAAARRMLANGASTLSLGTPRTSIVLHQVWCRRCGCGNVNREPYFVVAAIRKYGCGVTRHQSCSGCPCHAEPKPWRKNWKPRKDLPELEFVEVVIE